MDMDDIVPFTGRGYRLGTCDEEVQEEVHQASVLEQVPRTDTRMQHGTEEVFTSEEEEKEEEEKEEKKTDARAESVAASKSDDEDEPLAHSHLSLLNRLSNMRDVVFSWRVAGPDSCIRLLQGMDDFLTELVIEISKLEDVVEGAADDAKLRDLEAKYRALHHVRSALLLDSTPLSSSSGVIQNKILTTTNSTTGRPPDSDFDVVFVSVVLGSGYEWICCYPSGYWLGGCASNDGCRGRFA